MNFDESERIFLWHIKWGNDEKVFSNIAFYVFEAPLEILIGFIRNKIINMVRIDTNEFHLETFVTFFFKPAWRLYKTNEIWRAQWHT